MKAKISIGYQGEATTKQEGASGQFLIFSTKVFLALSGITGLWAVSCLVIGLKECGIVGLLKLLIVSVTGG